MREITKDMIYEFRLKKLGYDFMGYPFTKVNQLSFHHLIVPKRDCKRQGLGEGYLKWNGAILRQDTSHEYLHVIEYFDYNLYLYIRHELIDENIKGFIDMFNLVRILEALHDFEEEFKDETNAKGHKIIKPEYLYRPALEEPSVSMKRVRK